MRLPHLNMLVSRVTFAKRGTHDTEHADNARGAALIEGQPHVTSMELHIQIKRSDVLRESLEQVQLKPGTNGCIVARGILHDPYTDQTVTYERSGNTEVVGDHVIPLAAAWDLGAAQWSLRKRQNFANDPRNLIITTSGANLSKGDKTPGEWMPEHGRCRYAQAYLEVARAYGVALTRADHRALTAAIGRC